MRVFTTTPTAPADRAMHEGPQCQEAQTDCLSEIFQRKAGSLFESRNCATACKFVNKCQCQCTRHVAL